VQPIATGLTFPHKDALVASFKPLGFSYRAKDSGHGVFELSKMTPSNNLVEFSVDVGTWSHFYAGTLMVRGWRWHVVIPVPVVPPTEPQWPSLQYPVGDVDHWRRIVENATAVVKLLDQTFVRDAEKEFGLSPSWFSLTE